MGMGDRGPRAGTSVFIIPGNRVKNVEDRLVVLSRVAESIIKKVRSEYSEHVFTYRGSSCDQDEQLGMEACANLYRFAADQSA